jgi:hypothetical protein
MMKTTTQKYVTGRLHNIYLVLLVSWDAFYGCPALINKNAHTEGDGADE